MSEMRDRICYMICAAAGACPGMLMVETCVMNDCSSFWANTRDRSAVQGCTPYGMAAWPSNMAPGATPTAPVPVVADPAAFLELQRQPETQYLQAWQNFAAISELSRAAMAKAEVPQEKAADDQAQKQQMKETKVSERTPEESEKPKEDENKELPEKMDQKHAAIPEPAEKPTAKTDVASTGLHGKVVLRIRKVGTYTMADGSLEIYARWTPKDEPDQVQISQEVKIVSAKPAGEDKVDAASKEADYMRPTPKKMPVSASSSSKVAKDVKEPPYPP